MSIESSPSGSLSLFFPSPSLPLSLFPLPEPWSMVLVSFKGGKSAISRSARSSIKARRREFSMSASGFSRCLFLFSSPLLFSRIFSELMFHYRSWRIIVRVLDIVLDQPVVDIHLRRSFRSRGGIIFVVIVSTKSTLLWVPAASFCWFLFKEITCSVLSYSKGGLYGDLWIILSNCQVLFLIHIFLWHLISTRYGDEKSIWPFFYRVIEEIRIEIFRSINCSNLLLIY